MYHEMDLAFDDMTWSVQGLNRGRGQFLNFLSAPMIAKSVFLAVNTSFGLLNIVSGLILQSPLIKGWVYFNKNE
jgi:hypothetical protein